MAYENGLGYYDVVSGQEIDDDGAVAAPKVAVPNAVSSSGNWFTNLFSGNPTPAEPEAPLGPMYGPTQQTTGAGLLAASNINTGPSWLDTMTTKLSSAQALATAARKRVQAAKTNVLPNTSMATRTTVPNYTNVALSVAAAAVIVFGGYAIYKRTKGGSHVRQSA